MEKIKMSTGRDLVLDGDLLSLVEAIFEEAAVAREMKHSYEDVMKEIDSVIQQLPLDEQRRYFRESLFLNTVTYENEMLAALAKKLGR